MHALLSLIVVVVAQTPPVPVPLVLIHGTDKDFVAHLPQQQQAVNGSSSNSVWIGVVVLVAILGMVAAYFVGYYVGSVSTRRESTTTVIAHSTPILSNSTAHVHTLASAAPSFSGGATHRQQTGVVPHSLAMALQAPPPREPQLPFASDDTYVNPYQIKSRNKFN